MGSFDAILVADADQQLADFGETGLIYHPTGRSDRPITAIVMRQPPELMEKPRTQVTPLRIQTLNDATTGITAAEWKDGDMLTIAPRSGGPTKRLRLLRPVAEDAGLVTWEVA